MIECHCILPIYKDSLPAIYHKFITYSKIDERGKIIPKYVNCNNCGITHYVYELCKSDIKVGKEDIKSTRTIEDIKLSLPDKIINILTSNNCTIEDYELVEDIFDQEIFPSNLIIKREIIDEEHHIKLLKINNAEKFKIESEVIKTIMR
tara:strand:- start:5285 stop:5731 length:447 start_codon:yes stop_codon:yes gene_type:complete